MVYIKALNVSRGFPTRRITFHFHSSSVLLTVPTCDWEDQNSKPCGTLRPQAQGTKRLPTKKRTPTRRCTPSTTNTVSFECSVIVSIDPMYRFVSVWFAFINYYYYYYYYCTMCGERSVCRQMPLLNVSIDRWNCNAHIFVAVVIIHIRRV